MIETNNNVLAATANECVRWSSFNDGPDLLDLIPSERGGSGMNENSSQPIAKHGMKYCTFQFTYIPESGVLPNAYAVVFHFQTSQDGIHWDDIDDASFTPNLDTLELSATKTSFTVEVKCLSNYIRVQATASVEAIEPNAGDTIRIYCTQMES